MMGIATVRIIGFLPGFRFILREKIRIIKLIYIIKANK